MKDTTDYYRRVVEWANRVLVQDVDGYWYASISGVRGLLSEHQIRTLADEMEARNALTTAHHASYRPEKEGARMKKKPDWIEP